MINSGSALCNPSCVPAPSYSPPLIFHSHELSNFIFYLFIMSTEARVCKSIILEDFGIYTAVRLEIYLFTFTKN